VNFLLVMMLVLVVMYVLMIRPQRKRQQEHASTINRLAPGDEVLTQGGIFGVVEAVDGDDLVIEIADGVAVHVTRRGIAAVVPPEEDVVEHVDETPDETRQRLRDEAAVTVSQELVNEEANSEAAPDARS
jgi:preprotein translocase subunit YajC